MILRFSLFLLLSIFLFSCQSNNSNNPQGDNQAKQLKDYYYPVNELEEGLVYIYENEVLNNQAEYWLHKTVYDEAGNQYLVSTQYNLLFDQNQMIREWIVADGSLVNDYRFFQKDAETGKSIASQASIHENVRFPFKAIKADSLAYRFNLDFSILPDSSTQYNITVDRRFDQFLKYPWEGDSIEAARFLCKEYRSIQNDTEGGSWNNESNSVEIYAKGIGLIYKDSDSKAFPYRIRLKEQITMEKFLKLQEASN